MGEAAIYMVVIDKSHVRGKAPPCKHGRGYSEQAGQAGMQGSQDREHSEIREDRAIHAEAAAIVPAYHQTTEILMFSHADGLKVSGFLTGRRHILT